MTYIIALYLILVSTIYIAEARPCSNDEIRKMVEKGIPAADISKRCLNQNIDEHSESLDFLSGTWIALESESDRRIHIDFRIEGRNAEIYFSLKGLYYKVLKTALSRNQDKISFKIHTDTQNMNIISNNQLEMDSIILVKESNKHFNLQNMIETAETVDCNLSQHGYQHIKSGLSSLCKRGNKIACTEISYVDMTLKECGDFNKNMNCNQFISFNFQQPMRPIFIREYEPSRKFLGIEVELMGGNHFPGIPIGGVWPTGPAEKAGLLKGDVIIKIDGKSVQNLSIREALNVEDVFFNQLEGKSVEFEIVRNGKKRNITIPLITFDEYLDLSQNNQSVNKSLSFLVGEWKVINNFPPNQDSNTIFYFNLDHNRLVVTVVHDSFFYQDNSVIRSAHKNDIIYNISFFYDRHEKLIDIIKIIDKETVRYSPHLFLKKVSNHSITLKELRNHVEVPGPEIPTIEQVELQDVRRITKHFSQLCESGNQDACAHLGHWKDCEEIKTYQSQRDCFDREIETHHDSERAKKACNLEVNWQYPSWGLRHPLPLLSR